ncbi:hypothetical protein GGTG_07999 [Gaeumannomyces tritici R3-111a-1]|uniref:SnoaL-like domain-containing protein n=1 Tax=Gaeumannomyces tritici (strain R3-111a-1) TaxID=644352 RepID=J3P3B1_GAET3|nr:hypothetical protein GGTG_07999 [Gaeumannomyces tritici R3-111a-1]EJT74153.1 hypothetical protein GGTG_07999 [Gaeumannomyces tritici R3-111a-1]
MRASTALAALLAALASAGRPKPEPYEAYDRLREAMTDDVVYDSRPLGPAYGGLSAGLEQTTANIRAAFGDALVEHQVGNALVAFTNDQATAANVSTYLTWSRWDKAAPGDVTKTFRIFERCDDVFVVDPKDGR